MKAKDPKEYVVRSDTKVPFTRELAERLLAMKQCCGERGYREDWAETLKRRYDEGRFHPEQITLITITLEGEEHLANGKHCAKFRLMDGMPSDKWAPPVRMLRYEVFTDEGRRALYSEMDRGWNRTTSHVICSHLEGTPQFEHLTKRHLTTLGAAYGFWRNPEAKDRRITEIDTVAEELRGEHSNLANYVADILTASRTKDTAHIWRMPVVAAVFATADVNPPAAKEFWEAVRDGTNLAKNDPRLHLMRWLQRHTLTQGRGQGATDPVSSEFMHRVCINQWNRWMGGLETRGGLRADMGAKRPKARRQRKKAG